MAAANVNRASRPGTPQGADLRELADQLRRIVGIVEAEMEQMGQAFAVCHALEKLLSPPLCNDASDALIALARVAQILLEESAFFKVKEIADAVVATLEQQP